MIKLPENFESYGDARKSGFMKMKELKESDKTIVIVSHSHDAIRSLCNRAIWIKDGHVKLDGETNMVIDKYLEECK